jgi:hypothetical protein
MNKVTWIGAVPHMSATISIPTAMMYDTPGSAPQPSGPPIRGVEDHRFFNVFGVGSSVFAATGTSVNGRIGIVWFEVSTAGAIVQQGSIASANFDALFPTIAADATGNVAIGYSKVSATEFASVYVASRQAADPPGTLGAPVVLAAGNSGYQCSTNPVGWGTYSSTVVDPSNPLVLWTFQEYAHSSTACQWSTRWVSFSL